MFPHYVPCRCLFVCSYLLPFYSCLLLTVPPFITVNFRLVSIGVIRVRQVVIIVVVIFWGSPISKPCPFAHQFTSPDWHRAWTFVSPVTDRVKNMLRCKLDRSFLQPTHYLLHLIRCVLHL